MNVFTSHEEIDGHFSGAVVAIGNFDGLHRGHQSLIRLVRDRAEQGAAATVLSFDPHPVQLLAPALAPPLLRTRNEKIKGLQSLGVDSLLLQSFTRDLAGTSPVSFVRDILIGSLDVQHVVVGPDFSFGKKAAGNISLLGILLEESGRQLTVVEPVKEKGLICSSSKIREFVLQGKMEAANLLLGHQYWLAGQVVSGDQRGRKLGFPTANILTERMALPRVGVYATWAQTENGKVYEAITNIGLRPTFDGQNLRIESHLFEFDEMIYGQEIKLLFVNRIRDEKRFSDSGQLRSQIVADCGKAREALAAVPADFGPGLRLDISR
jgi:riboflavin kinase / FMN adenylyltransferase